MALTTWDLRCHVDHGTPPLQTVDVTADQRDMAAWELEHGTSSLEALRATPQLAFRWLAWHALQRTGRTLHGWPEWSAKVVEVEPADEDVEPDPGNPAAPATAS